VRCVQDIAPDVPASGMRLLMQCALLSSRTAPTGPPLAGPMTGSGRSGIHVARKPRGSSVGRHGGPRSRCARPDDHHAHAPIFGIL
jgi:hypothetical protein